MKKIVLGTVTVSLLGGCTTEMESAAQQDRQTFLACKAANPTTWGDKCNGELQMYQTTSLAAETDSARRAQTMNAIGAGLLAGAAAVAAGAAAAEASRPVYVMQPVYVQPVVVCRWRC